MAHRSANARINVKVLIIVLLVAAAAGVSLVAARQIRRNMTSEAAYEEGQRAYDANDWAEAAKQWKIYLAYHPQDVKVLRKYGESLLNIRPPVPQNVAGAISAYAQLMKLVPQERAAYEKLSMLYTATRQFDSLAQVAQTRLRHAPNDPNASLWLAQAQIGLEKDQDARQTLATLIDALETQPGRQKQYVQACLLMSDLKASGEQEEAGNVAAAQGVPDPNQPTEVADANTPKTKTPLDWLDSAVVYDPNSMAALLARAQLCRRMAGEADPNSDVRRELMARAHSDLEAAAALESTNPRFLYALGAEWVFHGELDRAEGQLAAVDALPPEIMDEHFFDPNDWRMMRCLFLVELASKRGEPQRAVDLVTETRETITEPRHLRQILPTAIDLYLVAGRVEDANDCLTQYEEVLGSREMSRDAQVQLASYQARVAMVKEQPYRVIEVLEPILQRERLNPQVWQLSDMLATAYQQTRQTSRAVDTWTLCLELLEQQPRMTESMLRRRNEIRQLLPTQYVRLGDWQRVEESTRDSRQQVAGSVDSRLLQIGAIVNRVTDQGERLNAAQLEALDQELAALRQHDPNDARIRVFQALLWSYRGQTDRAEAELKLAIEECEDSQAAEMQLVGLYRRTDRPAEAISVCRRATEKYPEAMEFWSTLSDLHEEAGDPNAARHWLEKGLENVADEADRDSLSIRLARLDLVTDDREAGIARLMELAENDPQETRARALLLTLPEIQDDPNAADRLIDELRRIEGENGLLWRFHQASLWFSSRDWRSKQEQIVELLQHCIRADARSTPPVLLLGRLYERMGDLRAAEGVYREALAASPPPQEVAERLANLLTFQDRHAEALEILPSIDPVRRPYISERAGDLSRAIADFERRIENDIERQDAESRVQLARLLYEQTKDAQRALPYLDEAKAIDPDSQTQVATRALILAAEGRVPEALQVLRDNVKQHDTFRAHWMLAVYLAEHGEPEQAEEEFRKLTTFADAGAAGYELLANFYVDSGRLDNAVTAIEEGAEAYPDSLRLKRRQMQLLLQRGQPQDRDKAREIRIALQQEQPESVELIVYEVMEKLEDPTPEALTEARGMLEQAVELSPLAVNAQLLLIDVLVRQGELERASEYSAQALEANPANTPLKMARARVELALGYGRTAFNLANEALQNEPNDADAMAIAVNGALISGDRRLQQQAATLIDTAIERIDDQERLLIARARLHNALGQPGRGIPELEAYCREEPGSSSVPALIMLAGLHRKVGDMDQADRAIARAETVAPDRQIVIHARFLWRVAQNRLADLQGTASSYIAAGEQDPAMVLDAASRLMPLGVPELSQEALQLFEHAATTWPDSLQARLGFGLTLYRMGQPDRARQVYEGLLKDYPENTQVLNDLAWILQEHEQDYQRALELANEGIRLAPSDRHLLDTRATILMHIPERLADAQRDLEQLLRELRLMQPPDEARTAEVLFELGQVCIQLEQLDQAKEYLATASEIDARLNVFSPEQRSEITSILQKETGK